MVAGFEAMRMLDDASFDRIEALGQRLRAGLADLVEMRGVSWQIGGQGSLFKLHPHPRTLVDYRSSEPTPDEKTQADQFYLGMLGQGVVLTPELAGSLSTPMTEDHVDHIVEAADRAFDALEKEA
jgi:glutamate-1-semialdehyde 2,1-aminomutase